MNKILVLLTLLQSVTIEAAPGICDTYSRVKLNSTIRKEILYMHNGVRDAIASGKYPEYGPAKNIKQLYWDEELELLAQIKADSCEFKNNSAIEYARINGYRQPSVHSIYMRYPSDPPARELIKVAINDWKHTTPEIIDNYQGGNKGYTYAQILWANTNRIGCAESRYKEPLKHYNIYYLVCYYTPGAMVRGEPIYLRGKPCSGCTNGTRCGIDPEFPNLCGDDKAPPVSTKNDEAKTSKICDNEKSYAINKFGTASFILIIMIAKVTIAFFIFQLS